MDSKKIHTYTSKEENEELTAIHKEALAATQNHTVFTTEVLEKNTNMEALTIIRDQVNIVKKTLENQEATLKILSQLIIISRHQKNTKQSRWPLLTARNPPLSKRYN